ncbi:MAG: NUDIX hydrolase [Actinomycetota bacterium]
MAFPGGHLEAGESSLDAAMRETREEIGIDASTARVVGELPAHRTISSSSHIVPHVVRLASEPRQFALNGEVDRVFSVSLGELVRADTFVQEHWVFQDREVVMGGGDAVAAFAGDTAATLADVWRGRLVSTQALGDDVEVIIEPERSQP